MKDLRDFLKERLVSEKENETDRQKIRTIEDAQKAAYFFCKNSASYVIYINPSNEKHTPVRTRFVGDLSKAVQTAKAEFKQINNCLDVVGSMSVMADLHGKECDIPNSYWN